MTEGSYRRIRNLIPGTLTYKGKVSKDFSIELIVYDRDKAFKAAFDTVQAYRALVRELDGDEVLWLNVTGLNNVEAIHELGTLFSMPQNVLELIVNVSRQSSYRMTPEWIYSDLQLVYLKGEAVAFEHLGLYTKGQVVITFQEREGDVFDYVRERIFENLGHIRSCGSDYLYYSLLDALVDSSRDVMEKVKHDIDLIEEDIIEEEGIDAREIHTLRKTILMLRMATATMDRMLGQMAARSIYPFPTTDQYHLDSLNDHNKDVAGELALQREVVNALFENHMLNNSNDMNNIMTTLTIFSAIFIPLSFLAGVFGMNFAHMPGLDYIHGFALFTGICLVIVVVMVGLFKVKKWF